MTKMLGRNKLIQFILTSSLQLLEAMIMEKASWWWEHGVAELLHLVVGGKHWKDKDWGLGQLS